jgi:hypothetical protein
LPDTTAPSTWRSTRPRTCSCSRCRPPTSTCRARNAAAAPSVGRQDFRSSSGSPTPLHGRAPATGASRWPCP